MLSSAITSISERIFDHSTAKSGFQSLTDQEIIKTVNDLSVIFPKSDAFTIKLPQIVCVGDQSSGKSSLLSGLIGMNLLPTGKEMVTRCALKLQLIHHEMPEAWACIGKCKINLTLPDPTHDEVYTIQEQIKKITIQHAGDNKNISNQEIVLTIHSPNVPNLTLVDLPGLTKIACTDKGQPKDIKQQIRTLISSYITDKESIILAVIPAREDVEVDTALEFAKEHDPDGDRICGILTKIDLMNKDNHVQKYLNDNVSVDLRLGYGYFAVNNVQNTSMHESLQQETQYFKNHPLYRRLGDRVGRMNVGAHLSKILVDRVRANIPRIMAEIVEHEKNVRSELNTLGHSLSMNTPDEQRTHVHVFLSTFTNQLTRSLSEKGTVNYGKYLKTHFINFRQTVRAMTYQYEDAYINEMIQNCNGNHMNVSVLSIDVLECCLQDTSQNTFGRFVQPSSKLVCDVTTVIHRLVDELLVSTELNRFHWMKTVIKQETSAFLSTLNEQMMTRIHDLVKTERSYIWTDDDVFNQKLQEMVGTSSSQSQTSVINRLINTYMSTVKRTVADQIPKMMMCFMIDAFTESLYNVLFEKISVMDIAKLLSEKPEIEQQRTMLMLRRTQIENAKEIMNM